MKIREEWLTVMESLFRYSAFYKLPFLISNVLPFISLSKDFLTSIKDVFLSFMIIAYFLGARMNPRDLFSYFHSVHHTCLSNDFIFNQSYASI